LIEISGKTVSVQIWDTAGQERFKSVNKFFYKNAVGVLLVFSLGSKESFNKVPQWLKEVRDAIDEEAVFNLVIFY
jgi:small GTP-binding protein